MTLNKKIFGLENSWFIYIIGTLSLLEACVFLILHYLMLIDISIIRELAAELWWVVLQLNIIRRVSFACFGVQGFRLISALVLILGRLKGSLEISAMFCLLTLFGIVGNIATGIYLVQHELTRQLAIAALVMIAIHIVYIFVCFKICTQEQVFKKKASSTSDIAQHQVQYIASPQDPVQFQDTSPVEDMEQAQNAISIQTPNRIENNFHRETPVDEYTVVEHRRDRPQPVCNGTCVPLQTRSYSPPPSYEEEETGPRQAVETKQDIEDPPLKVYI